MLIDLTEKFLLVSKVLWENQSIENFLDRRKKISYGSEVGKVSNKKFASVGL